MSRSSPMRSSEDLASDSKGFNHAIVHHVCRRFVLNVQADVMGARVVARGLLGHGLKQRVQGVETRVLCEGSGDDFKGISKGFNGQLFSTSEAFSKSAKVACKGDLSCSAAGEKVRFFEKLAGDAQRIGKTPLDFTNRFVG